MTAGSRGLPQTTLRTVNCHLSLGTAADAQPGAIHHKAAPQP